VIRLAADILRESQRAPAVAAGAVLIALTLSIAATSFGTRIEGALVGATLGLFRLADWLPFVDIAPYIETASDGDLSFSLQGDTGGAFLNDVLLPFYAWLTAALLAIRWVFRMPAPRDGFWPRLRPSLILGAVCLGVFALAALQRDDVAGLAVVFGVFLAGMIALAAYASGIGAIIDAVAASIIRRLPGSELEPA